MKQKTSHQYKIPTWFNGTLYHEGGTVRNRFSGEEYKLNNVELSIYDFIMGATVMAELGAGADVVDPTPTLPPVVPIPTFP